MSSSTANIHSKSHGSRHWDVIIIGAGAAGLHCAALAGKRGRRVLVIDHANKPGKKILMSGGGRCNFTNYYIEPSCYLSNNPHFCKSALSRYTQWDFISLVEGYQLAYHEKALGQLFCDGKASDILNILLAECDQANVTVRLKESIEQVKHCSKSEHFEITTSAGQYGCQSLVVASGGPSIPTLGATGYGYQLAEQFGHHVIEPRAALVPFTISDHLKPLCQSLSGTSLGVVVNCRQQQFTENMLFTHRGLSGPSMLQISSYWQQGDELEIDLLPNLDVSAQLRQDQHQRPKTQLKTWLAELTTQKFAECWLPAVGFKLLMSVPLAELDGQQMDHLDSVIKQWRIKPSGTEGYRTAEVALGGVCTSEISSKTMQSQRVPGLFFIGEVVDVTGHLGGFNFQWAWSSAAAAAESL